MLSDIEIASCAKIENITKIAEELGVDLKDLELYGNHKAKINVFNKKREKKGKLILVTAINPTPAGEGKTTISIGLADAMKKIGKKVCLALREPSLGPVFGMKGGAAGGGYAQVIPMEDINLHFTGDLHAITSANNLLCSMIDNHIHQGNELNIDVTKVLFKRCVDLNDRALRDIVIGIGGTTNGKPRQDGFTITAACEIMAVLCLATDLSDLKKRLASITVALNDKGEAVTAHDLKAEDAMTILLKDAIKPNLVQTLEKTPCIMHGGPFANIAHGCNSIIATKTALEYADYVVTEAGFGADLGAEKFLDVKCRMGNLKPDAVVIVATIKALKMHGNVAKADLHKENVEALKKGIPNLVKHIENIKNVFNLNVIVAINRYYNDTEAEIKALEEEVKKYGVDVVMTDVFAKGGEGGTILAEKVVNLTEQPSNFKFCYEDGDGIEEKITKIATKIYGADGVIFESKAKKEIERLTKQGYTNLPVVIAKTQYSLSDDQTKLGRPAGFKITVKEIVLRSGANFIVAIAGNMLLMPGLPKSPAAVGMTIDENGKIAGLF